MQKRRITLPEAKKMVADNKENTRFFDGSFKVDKLYNIFIKDFTDEECKVIIASLRLAGAKFNYS